MYVSTSGEYCRSNCTSTCSCIRILSITSLGLVGCWAFAASANTLSDRAAGRVLKLRIMTPKLGP